MGKINDNTELLATILARVKNLPKLKISSISINGVAVEPDGDKNVNITIPTKLSEFTNDKGFVDAEALRQALENLEIPTAPIQSISVNGENVAPDENKNVDIQIPESGSELTLMGETTLNTNASIPYSFAVPLNDTLTKNDLVYVEMNNGLSLIGSLYAQIEVIANSYEMEDSVYIDKFLVSVSNRLDTGKGQVSFSMLQQEYDGYIGTVKVYVQKNALTFSE